MEKARHRRDFVSEDIGVDRSEFAVTVGFAKNLTDENSDDALLMQRSLDPTEDKPGIDGVYVGIPPQRYAMYGGITEAVLLRNLFCIKFTDSGAANMGGNSEFIVHFDLVQSKFQDLQDGLRFIFKGCSCYRENAA